MNLVLYSADGFRINTKIDKVVRNLLSKNSSISCLSSFLDKKRRYFNQFLSRFKKNGYKNFKFFELPRNFKGPKINEIFKSKAIYLAGGDPHLFLAFIHKRGLKRKLVSFVKRGGVLLGASAGAMLMTPTVDTTIFLNNDPKSYRKLKPTKALSLVDFEFFPHYQRKEELPQLKKIDYALKKRSLLVGRPIIACREGEGLIIWGETKIIIGDPVVFKNGAKTKLKTQILIKPLF